MNLEHLSYVLGKLVCWMRRGKHEYGPKFKAKGISDTSYAYSQTYPDGYYKKCVICGHDIATGKPVRRVERRT